MNTKSILIGLVLVGAIAGGVFYVKSQQQGHDASHVAQNFRVKGPANAKVKIVEYSDFQCPACKRAVPYFKEFREEYPNDVSIQFKHFPLDGHLWAATAHQAAECGGEQGKFWPFHDKLYDEQANWSGPTNPISKFMEYAKGLSLDLDKFAACMADEAIKERIMNEKKDGLAAQVKSTPTIFINEERLVGPVQLRKNGDKVIRSLLGLPEKAVATETVDDHAGHNH